MFQLISLTSWKSIRSLLFLLPKLQESAVDDTNGIFENAKIV